MGDAGGKLTERRQFFGLHQAVLGSAQIVKRLR